MRTESNFKVKAKELKKYADKISGSVFKKLMYRALMEVSFTSVKDYMIMTSNVLEAIGFPVDPNFLTVRTGRLSRSILDAPSFGRVELPTDVEAMMQSKPTGTNVAPTKGKSEGYKRVIISGRTIEGIIGTDVEYAEKHEKGHGVKARPFLTPAASDSMPTIKKMFEQTVEETFKRENI
jgi:hypothetical protein